LIIVDKAFSYLDYFSKYRLIKSDMDPKTKKRVIAGAVVVFIIGALYLYSNKKKKSVASKLSNTVWSTPKGMVHMKKDGASSLSLTGASGTVDVCMFGGLKWGKFKGTLTDDNNGHPSKIEWSGDSAPGTWHRAQAKHPMPVPIGPQTPASPVLNPHPNPSTMH